MRVDDVVRNDIPADLMEASNKFLEAAREYRAFLKRHHRDRLAGVIWVESSLGEMVLYSENQRYTNAIKDAELGDW